MGKTKKGKSKPHKANPTGLPSVKDFDMEDEQGSSSLAPILEQLNSNKADDKMCGLQALSTLCQREHNIQAIVDSDLVRIASPLLMDPDVNIRHAAAGAIRNLSAVSVEICENLVEQDVLTPLLMLLNQYANNEWLPGIDKRSNQLDPKTDTFIQAANIVWNLCESTTVALESFNQSQLLQSFVRCLNYETFGMEIAISVGQCLLVISEDNSTAWRILANCSAELSSLLKIEGDFQTAILRTVVAGIMSNVPALQMQHFKEIIEALSRTIAINHRTVLNELTSRMPLSKTSAAAPPIEVMDDEMNSETEADASLRRLKDELPTELEQEIKHVGYLLSAQRISAEVLSNMVCSQDDDEMSEEIDDKSDAESVQDYDANQNGNQNGNNLNADKITTEAAEIIKALQIVEKLYQRAQVLPVNVQQILADFEKNLCKRQNALRVSSLLCLHNFCNCMSTEELGGSKAIYDVWLDLGQQIFQIEQDFDMLEASTSLMRATLEHLKSSPELFKQWTENDLQLILNGVETCESPAIKANWLKMLGTLGFLLEVPMVKKITEFILDKCAVESDVWTMSEALDSFMDMFSERDHLQIVHDLNVVAKSRELEKILKTKMRQQKRELGDRYPAIVTVRNNLTRFCKYLDNQQKNFVPT